jgi:hypothetical protein
LLLGVGWNSILLLVANGRSRMEFHPTLGNKRSQLHKVYQSPYTAKNAWLWAERLPETCRVVIPIKLEFSASVEFIHKKNICPCQEFNHLTQTSSLEPSHYTDYTTPAPEIYLMSCFTMGTS